MRKKICFIVSSPLSARVFLKAHMQQLEKTYDIWLVANFSDNPNFVIDDVKLSGVKDIKMSRSSISLKEDTIAVLQLIKFLKKQKFDAVHSITPKAGLVGMFSAKMAGIKYRVHSFTGQIWANDKGLRRVLYKNIDRFINFLTSYTLVDGYSQQEYLIKEKVASTKSLVLANGSICGVDLKRFYPRKEIRNDLRKELNYSNTDVVFIFMGRLNKDKGVFELVEAFSNLKKKYSKARLLLIGPDEGNVKQSSSFKDGIHFYGYTNTPELLLNVGDIFCLPSHREGFGSSVIEASATGLPVICSNVYGIRDAFNDEETGLAHKVNDSSDLEEKMTSLLVNRKWSQELGENGRQFVESHFEESIVTKAFARFYKNLFSDKK